MKRAFSALLVLSLLLLGSVTVFAADGYLPYKPITHPPVITKKTLPALQPTDPAAIEREKGIAAGQDPDSFQNPWHNRGAR